MNTNLCNKITSTFGCCFLASMEDDGCKCLFHETRQMLECLLALRFSNLNFDSTHIVGSRALCKNNLGYCSNL